MTDENPDRYQDQNWLTVDQLEDDNLRRDHRHGQAWRLSEPDASKLGLSDWLWIGGLVAAIVGLIVVAIYA